ncbi:MAG: M23 family metallopeptidase [Hyphomonadaceae bacterium]
MIRTGKCLAALLLCGAALSFLSAAAQEVDQDKLRSSLQIGGSLQQGGFVRGYLPEGMELSLAGKPVARTSEGHFIIGLDRDAPDEINLTLNSANGTQELALSIAPRSYREGQVIQGLSRGIRPPSDGPLGPDDLFESDETPANDLARNIAPPPDAPTRAEQSQSKTQALQSRADLDGFMQDWIYPFETPYRISSPWGAARTVRGNPRIHYGVDIAAPLDTNIKAPAAGIVTLAATDYYYEGGVVFIDHGLGLTSIYLHMSALDVEEGDLVEQGQSLGKVGAEGRATGPHLCWRLYWNGREVKLDPQGF